MGTADRDAVADAAGVATQRHSSGRAWQQRPSARPPPTGFARDLLIITDKQRKPTTTLPPSQLLSPCRCLCCTSSQLDGSMMSCCEHVLQRHAAAKETVDKAVNLELHISACTVRDGGMQLQRYCRAATYNCTARGCTTLPVASTDHFACASPHPTMIKSYQHWLLTRSC